MAPSVPSSPNPRLIRPTQPRGRWIHGLLSACHAFPLLSRGGENHRLCFLRARKNRAGVPTYCHDTSRFSGLLLCPPCRRAIPCWSRTDLTAEGSRCRFDAHKRRTATSACDESKHPGSISRSAICQGEGGLPQRGRSSESKVHTGLSMAGLKQIKGNYGWFSKEAGGGPHSPRPGSYPAMEAGRRVRSSGIPRPPPSRNAAC